MLRREKLESDKKEDKGHHFESRILELSLSC